MKALHWIEQADGWCDFVNQEYLRACGLGWNEIRGDGWLRLIHPDDIEPIARIKSIGMAAKKPIAARGRMIINTGEFCNYTFVARPVLDRRGNVYRWHGKARLLLSATQLYLSMFVGELPTEAYPAEPDPPMVENVIKLSDFKRA